MPTPSTASSAVRVIDDVDDDDERVPQSEDPAEQQDAQRVDDDDEQVRPLRPSEAQRMFAALPGSLATIGKPLGATKQSVDQWRKGACVPEDRFRRAIASHYGIPFNAWGLDEPDEQADDDTDDDELGELTADPLDEYRRLIKIVRKQLARGALTARERAQLTDSYTRTLGQMSRLEREREMLEARTIRDHAKWKVLKNAIITALLPHPAAARDVEAAITRVLSDESDDAAD
jgi:transcriptional regulator with XRE-family HTH domain